MMYERRSPRTFAADRNSRARSESSCDRSWRAWNAQLVAVSTTIIVTEPGGR